MDGNQLVTEVCDHMVCFGLIHAVLLKENIVEMHIKRFYRIYSEHLTQPFPVTKVLPL